jgi:hypothetical protein
MKGSDATVRGGLLALLAATALAGPATAAQPYALRAIPVGITLEQFRALPYPDHRQHAGVAAVCSSDPTAAGLDALRLTPILVEADVVKCGYFQAGFGGATAPRVAAPLQFLGEEVTPLFLFYRQRGAPSYRLAQITFAMSNRRSDALIVMFHRAFGNAPELQVSTVQTGFGPQLANITYTWNNGVSTVRLDTITVVLNQMSVVFVDNRLGSSLDERLDAIARRNRIAEAELAKTNDAEAAPAAASESKTEKGATKKSGADALPAASAETPAEDGKAAAAAPKAPSAAPPASAISPALAGMAAAPDAADGAAPAAPPSYIEPPLNLPSPLGSFTFK